MSAVRASLKGFPLIDDVCSNSHNRPEITATTRQAHVPRRARSRNKIATVAWCCKTGPAMSTPKITLPTATAVAAKCTARVATIGAPAADQSIATVLYRPTWKVKLPSVLWVSTDNTCQLTW